MLDLIRRVSASPSVALDAVWSHAANSDADWTGRGFVSPNGIVVEPGGRDRQGTLLILAESSDGVELAGEHAATITVAMVERLTYRRSSGVIVDLYRQRSPVDMTLGDVAGEFDLPATSARLYPRIIAAPTFVGAPVTLAFYAATR